MKYVILDDDKKVIDILIDKATELYPDKQRLEVADETVVAVGMAYSEATETFVKYEEPIAEPTQLDKIEANLDYLVLLNS